MCSCLALASLLISQGLVFQLGEFKPWSKKGLWLQMSCLFRTFQALVTLCHLFAISRLRIVFSCHLFPRRMKTANLAYPLTFQKYLGFYIGVAMDLASFFACLAIHSSQIWWTFR